MLQNFFLLCGRCCGFYRFMSYVSINVCWLILIIFIILLHTALSPFIFFVFFWDMVVEYLLAGALFACLSRAIYAIKGVMTIIN